jgi:malate dehydrogenase (oxaloacetate-decarboxylating)(NADP+)
MLDSRGVIHRQRNDLSKLKEKYASNTQARTLEDAINGCDLFLGVSQPNLINKDMLMSMADKPIILAMANPIPEISPELVAEYRPDAIMATGRSDYPNQVNNVLCFPFLFRGALDVGATTVTEGMKHACVKALAELATQPCPKEVETLYKGQSLIFGTEYILPKPFDPRLINSIAPAVAQAAINDKVATLPFENIDKYREGLLKL